MNTLPADFCSIKRGVKFISGGVLWEICGFSSEGEPAVRAFAVATEDEAKWFLLDDKLVNLVKEFKAIWGNLYV